MTTQISFFALMLTLVLTLSSFQAETLNHDNSITKIEEISALSYGGSASARAQNSDGIYRTISASTYCYHQTDAAARGYLMSSLNNNLRSDETLGSVSYSISSCGE